MKLPVAFLPLPILLLACGEKPRSAPEIDAINETVPVPIEDPDRTFGPLSFEQVDDNIAHDTLFIQTTFKLPDSSFVMVAMNKAEDPTEDQMERVAGLRLVHYRIDRKGEPEMLAYSSPAYDSWTMFPTFFPDPINEGAYIILANFGERNSWGQRVIRFGDQGFTDLGYLDIAAIEHNGEGDEAEVKLRNIGPHTRIGAIENEIIISFELDEMLLYDDLRGGLEQPIKAGRVQYRWSEAEGMLLYIDGEARREEQPS